MVLSQVVGTGHFLPGQVLTNFDVEKRTDTTDEWIRKRTGIAQRHAVETGQATSDLAVHAARRALEAAGLTPDDIDIIVCCTTSPDYYFPSSGCVIQEKLDASCPAYDVNAACSGFMYGLASADAFIRSGVYRTILLIGAEVVTNRINWEHRDTAVLFGDGAGAVVLRGIDSERGVLSTYLGADGRGRELLWYPVGGSKNPYRPGEPDQPEARFLMKGPELFKQAVTVFADAARRALADTGLTARDVDLFVPHQANARIIGAVAERLDLSDEQVYMNIDRVANTTAASIPIALDQAVQEGRLKEDQHVLAASFGAGLTWASSIIRW